MSHFLLKRIRSSLSWNRISFITGTQYNWLGPTYFKSFKIPCYQKCPIQFFKPTLRIASGTISSVLHVPSYQNLTVVLTNGIIIVILTMRQQIRTLFKCSKVHTIKCNRQNHNICLTRMHIFNHSAQKLYPHQLECPEKLYVSYL